MKGWNTRRNGPGFLASHCSDRSQTLAQASGLTFVTAQRPRSGYTVVFRERVVPFCELVPRSLPVLKVMSQWVQIRHNFYSGSVTKVSFIVLPSPSISSRAFDKSINKIPALKYERLFILLCLKDILYLLRRQMFPTKSEVHNVPKPSRMRLSAPR